MGIDEFLESGNDVLKTNAKELERRKNAEERAKIEAKVYFTDFEDKLRDSIKELEILLDSVNIVGDKIDLSRKSFSNDNRNFHLTYHQGVKKLKLEIFRKKYGDNLSAKIHSSPKYFGIFNTVRRVTKLSLERYTPLASLYKEEIKDINNPSQIHRLKKSLENYYAEQLVNHDGMEKGNTVVGSCETMVSILIDLPRYFSPFLKKFIEKNMKDGSEEVRV